MSKKSHPLDGLNNILGTLKNDPAHPSPAPVEQPLPPSLSSNSPASKGVKGRPATGKKSDEDYCQTTISIRKTTRKRVKQALLDAETGQDVSDLVETLLSQWLNSKS